jgi:CHAT domain-containing protein
VPRYVAVVLESGEAPVILDLGEAGGIDHLVGAWRDHMLRVASSGRAPTIVEQHEYDRLARDLYDRVWGPVEGYAAGQEMMLIAPDGALNTVAFAALKADDGEYLIEKHVLHYLSAGRDLVRLEHKTEPSVGLFALGDPDYGAKASERLAAASQPQDSVVQVAFVTRNLRSSCGRLSAIEVSPLPGTRREVESVCRAWAESTLEPAVACYGGDASEERFKAEAPGKRVIHLATHGYFLGGACKPEGAIVGENPLLLSGLFFAGANLHGEEADSLGAEDGILTAYEVSAMDLKGTELVVLSACETGLGEVAEGEGVYGLRRAFQMAGARTVVSALWPVSDESTAQMMGQLYRRSGETLPDAMRRVQLEKIGQLRSAGTVDHPFTWGAFIALGDWR